MNHIRNKWPESVEVNTEWVTETKTALLSRVGPELVWTVLGAQELQASVSDVLVSFLTEWAVFSLNYSLLKSSRDSLNEQQSSLRPAVVYWGLALNPAGFLLDYGVWRAFWSLPPLLILTIFSMNVLLHCLAAAFSICVPLKYNQRKKT